MFIYKITNIINNKVYIGKTEEINVETRWKSHLYNLKKGNHPNRHLQFSYNKYNEINFKFEVLESNVVNINERETYYIKLYDAFNDKKGYNLTEGGDGTTGMRHNKVSKSAIGEASRQRGGGKIGGHKLIGKKRPKEVIDAIRKANTNRIVSLETREKFRQARLGKSNPCLNKAVEDSNGNKFNSVKEAAIFYNVTPDSISRVLTGKRKTIKKVTFTYLKVGG